MVVDGIDLVLSLVCDHCMPSISSHWEEVFEKVKCVALKKQQRKFYSPYNELTFMFLL